MWDEREVQTPTSFYFIISRILGKFYRRKSLCVMETKNKKNEELQSRREFFKKAAKGVLPILGAVVLAGAPAIVKATEDSPMGCNYGCSSSCLGHCYGACGSACSTSCMGSCRGTCDGNCTSACTRGCSIGCTGYTG